MNRHPRHLVASGMMALALSAALVPHATAQSSVVDVPPPQVLDYWVSISRQPAGVLVFDGYAPDAATRASLAEHQGADISWLKLGSGAPSGYDAAVEFGLSVLDRLAEGRFALRGSVVTLNGVASNQADFLDLRTALASDLPTGLVLAKAEISAPRIDAYSISLRRQPNGNVLLSGFVPNPELEQRLLTSVGARASSTLRFASGEPTNFEASLDKALPLFAHLQQGEIKLENGQWLLSGAPLSADDDAAIRSAFEEGALSQSGWSLALAAPQPSAPDEPYRWSIEKSADGVVMTGSVPTEAFRRVLTLRVGSALDDETSVVTGQPETFITRALAAADALALLEVGKVEFDGSTWLIEGQGDSEAVEKAVAATGDDWSIAISAPAEPVAVAATDAPQAIVSAAEDPAPTAVEPAAPPAQEEAASPTAASDDVPLCRSRLAELSAQNGILFRSGAAVLAEGAETVLQSIAEAVGHCPSVAIEVAGHTDSDGEAAANLALSVARAEAVVTALIGLGVAPERLYAIGYGEGSPVADNATAAGKAQNRRIVVSVRDDS